MSKVECTFSADSIPQLVDQLRGFVAAHQPAPVANAKAAPAPEAKATAAALDTEWLAYKNAATLMEGAFEPLVVPDMPYGWETPAQWFSRAVQRTLNKHRATVGKLEAELAQVKGQADKLRDELERVTAQKRSVRGAMEDALAVLDQ